MIWRGPYADEDLARAERAAYRAEMCELEHEMVVAVRQVELVKARITLRRAEHRLHAARKREVQAWGEGPWDPKVVDATRRCERAERTASEAYSRLLDQREPEGRDLFRRAAQARADLADAWKRAVVQSKGGT